ncbi:MAG: LysR family transcriptional regulator [Propionibacteriaceae bacterium]|nr:LysR family transcriptional regulator [Propionibacteriaceae bacterium]
MALDPRRLLILRAVADAGSISAGARRLGWTQPAISRHIRDLERSAGTPLLLRHADGVTPTPAGQALLAHADAIAAHLDAAATEVAELRELRRGTVRVACFPSGLATLVPAALARLEASSPGLDVRLTEAEPDRAGQLLDCGEADIAVVFDYPDAPGFTSGPGQTAVPIREDEIRLVLPASHPDADRTDLTLAELADAAWVAGCPRCREHLLSCARAAGFTPRVYHETDDYVVAQSLVGQGLAVTVLPQTALDAYRDPRVAVKALPELSVRRIAACHRPGADRVPSVRAVLKALVG